MFWPPFIGAGIGGLSSLISGKDPRTALLNAGIGGAVGAGMGYGMNKFGSMMKGVAPAARSSVGTPSAASNIMMGSGLPSSSAISSVYTPQSPAPTSVPTSFTPMDYAMSSFDPSSLAIRPKEQPRMMSSAMGQSGIGGSGSYHSPVVPENPYEKLIPQKYRDLLVARMQKGGLY